MLAMSSDNATLAHKAFRVIAVPLFLSVVSYPAAAQITTTIGTESISGSYSGSLVGYFGGTYYDYGGYGLSPSSCVAQFGGSCVFSSLPTTISVSGQQTETITNVPLGGSPLTETVTTTDTVSSVLGSTTASNQYSFGTSPGSFYVPSPTSFNISFPTPTNPNLFGGASGQSGITPFTPVQNTFGGVALTTGAVDLQQPQAPSLHVVNTLVTPSLTGGSISYSTTLTPPPTVQQLEVMAANA